MKIIDLYEHLKYHKCLNCQILIIPKNETSSIFRDFNCHKCDIVYGYNLRDKNFHICLNNNKCLDWNEQTNKILLEGSTDYSEIELPNFELNNFDMSYILGKINKYLMFL